MFEPWVRGTPCSNSELGTRFEPWIWESMFESRVPENYVRTVGSGNSMFKPWFKDSVFEPGWELCVRTLASGTLCSNPETTLRSNPSGNCMRTTQGSTLGSDVMFPPDVRTLGSNILQNLCSNGKLGTHAETIVCRLRTENTVTVTSNFVGPLIAWKFLLQVRSLGLKKAAGEALMLQAVKADQRAGRETPQMLQRS